MYDAEKNRAYYRKFRASPAGQAHKARLEAVRKATALMRDVRKAVPCADCGGSFPGACMDFDHREPDQKAEAVSMLSARPWRTQIAEMDKCDVVCANCHRIRTQVQRGLLCEV